jgi:hypothetical protein
LFQTLFKFIKSARLSDEQFNIQCLHTEYSHAFKYYDIFQLIKYYPSLTNILSLLCKGGSKRVSTGSTNNLAEDKCIRTFSVDVWNGDQLED